MANQRDADKFPGRVWAPRGLWLQAGGVATAQGTDRTAEIIKFLRWYVGEDGAEPPTRPEPGAPPSSS